MTSPASSIVLLTPPLFEANSKEHIILSLQCKVFFFKKQPQYYHYISRERVINHISNQCSKLELSVKWPKFSFVLLILPCVHLKRESAKFKHHIGSSMSYFLSMYKFSLHLFFSLDFAEMLIWHPHRVV